MKKQKIRTRDLKQPEYAYTYYPGGWGRMGGDTCEYRHPRITVSRVTVFENGIYLSEVFELKGQTHREHGQEERPSYGWEITVKTADTASGGFTRFLAAYTKISGRRYLRADVRLIVLALKAARIPRYVWAREYKADGEYKHIAPRHYKGREKDYSEAFRLTRQLQRIGA